MKCVSCFCRIRGATLFALFIATAFSAGAAAPYHSADTSEDWDIGLSEVLRVIQFYNTGKHHCDEGTEDGYAPGPGDTDSCDPHNADYAPADWSIDLSELLRIVQFFNARVYSPNVEAEDGFGPHFDEEPPSDTGGEFLALKEFIKSVPDMIVAPDMLTDISDGLDGAGKLFDEGDVCGSGEKLDDVIGLTQALRSSLKGKANKTLAEPKIVDAKGQKIIIVNGIGVAESLFVMCSALQYDMIAARARGKEPCPKFPRVGAEVDDDVMEQDLSGVKIHFAFGAPRFWSEPRTDQKAIYSKLRIPGMDVNAGTPGTPGIPILQRIIAVPPDSQLSFEVSYGGPDTMHVRLAPSLPQPVDQTGPGDDPPPLEGELEPPPLEFFEDPDYFEDRVVYDSDKQWPPSPVQVVQIGKYRHLNLAQVIVYGGTYSPLSEELTLFEDVNVDISFNSQVNGFLDEAAMNPFESTPSLYTETVLNVQAVLNAGLIGGLVKKKTGEELMILTHPDFLDAANTLRDWKRAKGIITNVYQCGTGSGITDRQTAAEIDAFIEDHYDESNIKPSYLLLMGDAEFIPPFYDMGIGTDWFYASWSQGFLRDTFPFFATGRIPVDTLAQANTVVNKIVNYEQNPPGTTGLDAFYKNATVASQFQCCRTDVAQVGTAQRTFAEVSEFARGVMVNNGYTVQRIYQETVDGDYDDDATPRRYYDGSLINAGIGPGSGFSWNGTRQNVIDAFNAGRFLILHRDHGWHSGWSHPPFDSSDVSNSLNNGSFLPVVFSVNCSSGLFDNETAPGAEGSSVNGVYFAERLLRETDGGAVGVIGDTRVSPSWPNTALTRGLFDAIWPNAIPSYGGNTSKRRLGDILNHAKIYLLTQINVAGQGVDAEQYKKEMRLFHVFGDPTLEIWTRDPRNFQLAGRITIAAFDPQINYLEVEYEVDEALITAYQLGAGGVVIPLGRGPVMQGEAQLELIGTPDRALPIMFSAEFPDAVVLTDSGMLPDL